MPRYNLLDVQADNDGAAIDLAKEEALRAMRVDAGMEHAVCQRIIHIEDADGKVIAEDIALDTTFLRDGGPSARALCDAAIALKEALEAIAALPLWGEPISDDGLKADLALRSEYDLGADEFEPSCDTESSQLRDAVEAARAALAALRDRAAGEVT